MAYESCEASVSTVGQVLHVQGAAYREKLRNHLTFVLAGVVRFRQRHDRQCGRTGGHEHHTEPQQGIGVQQRGLGREDVDQRDADGGPEDEAHEPDQARGRPRDLAAAFAFFHAQHRPRQLHADHEHLQRREQIAEVLDRARQPRVQVAAVLLVLEEEAVDRRDQADDGAEQGADQRWVDEGKGELKGFLRGRGKTAPKVGALLVRFEFCMRRAADRGVRKKRGFFVGFLGFLLLSFDLLIVRRSLFLFVLIPFRSLHELGSQGERERVADHGVHQKERLCAVDRVVARVDGAQNAGGVQRLHEQQWDAGRVVECNGRCGPLG
nr:hypothetical protein CFP56_37303 [Quercus suber]